MYRNRVTFHYQDIKNRSVEYSTVIDQHDVIRIDVHRDTFHSNPVPFASVCQDILVLLEGSAKEVEEVLQNSVGRGFEELPKYSVSRSLHYVCDHCPTSSELHYLTPEQYHTSDLEITCSKNRKRRPLTEKEKVWFPEEVNIFYIHTLLELFISISRLKRQCQKVTRRMEETNLNRYQCLIKITMSCFFL